MLAVVHMYVQTMEGGVMANLQECLLAEVRCFVQIFVTNALNHQKICLSFIAFEFSALCRIYTYRFAIRYRTENLYKSIFVLISL